MEVSQESVSPHIQRVLKSFQSSANRTLHGPSVSLLSHHAQGIRQMADLSSTEDYAKAFESKTKDLEHMYRNRVPFPVQQVPLFTPADSSWSEKSETVLEGEKIACFVVGGEKRLCLPQILNTVLRDYELPEINSVCDDLHIFCSRCQPEQLDILKVSGILPPSAPSCGLITKTDAERLCNALIRTASENAPALNPSPNSFKVYHECFGKCKGNFNPDAYSSPTSNCIQCTDCWQWLSPQKFVCHSHKALENRTCHWGFDSANWRKYLLLAKHQPGIDKLQDVLEHIKGRYDSSSKHKRKQGGFDGGGEAVKRSKSEDSSSSPESPWTGSPQQQLMSAFHLWSSSAASSLKDGKVLPAPPAIMQEGCAGTAPKFLHSGPPVLLHPDKVVPHSDSTRYEPNYAPNVSLAPVQKCKMEDDDEEDVLEPGERKRGSDPAVTPATKPYREWDLSESDDSSLEQMSPAHGFDSGSSESQRAMEIELEMIRQALDGKIGEDKDDKDRFLHEFCKLRSKHQELLARSVQARRNLKSELSRSGEQSQHGQKYGDEKPRRDSQHAKQHNGKDSQHQDETEIKKLARCNEELQSRMQHYELLFEQLRVENGVLRDKLQQLGVNVGDLVKTGSQQLGVNVADIVKTGSQQLGVNVGDLVKTGSPLLPPTFPLLHPRLLHLHMAAAAAAADRYVKQEHNP